MVQNELTKEDLEKRKLIVEISELSKRWYRKPSNLFPVFTFIIAFGTIIWSFASGLLSVQIQSLALDRKSLEADIRSYTNEKNNLLAQNKLLRDSLTNVRNSNNNAILKFTKDYAAHEKRVIDSLSNKTRSNELADYYKKQLDSLTYLIIKQKASTKALMTENGDYIVTEDGKKILSDY